MNPDKQYMAIHPHRLLLEGDASMFLKLTSPDDSEQLYELVHENRHHLSKYQHWARDINFETLHAAVQASVQKISEDGWLQYRIMIPSKDARHRMIGTVTLYARDWLNRTACLGIWLAEAEQGKGYARKACQRIMAYAFPTWNLAKMFMEIEPGNERSEGLATRLGFTQTAEVRTETINDEEKVLRIWTKGIGA